MSKKVAEFQKTVWGYYDKNRREMPWRLPGSDGTFDEYKILVSEIMLQQTQVERVIPKFEAFIAAYPTHTTLAKASFQAVLKLWSGLGYSRRAKYLHDIAKRYANEPLPRTMDELVSNKGIGYNTAAAILTYTYNEKHVYIETNIRTVFLHHFFVDKTDVSDAELLQVIENDLPESNYRDFYLALMDYGSYLKKSGIKNNAKSRHYTKQSRFEGSLRQLRGVILRYIQDGALSVHALEEVCKDNRTRQAIDQLQKDGLVVVSDETVSVAV